MSARTQLMQVVTKAAVVLGALFLVTVVLAAIPIHNAPRVSIAPLRESSPASAQRQDPQPVHHKVGMEMDDDSKSQERDAVAAMSGHDHGDHSAHMFMT